MDEAMPESGLSQRERNKLEKRSRIKAAVRKLIESKGYDEMTTREIARHADVGLGTLFSYATNKRDLLFLVFNDEQEMLVEAAYRDIPAALPFAEQLIAVFRPFYEFFAAEPTFARYLLRELIFYESGAEAARFQQGRRRIVTRVEQLVVAAQNDGRLGTTEDGRAIARLVFAVYQAEIRRWLLESDPRPENGLESLRRALGIVIRGLEPSETTR
ncbi:MAG TPA: TetR/AcrR family transcriptional regulator [Alphaproteobacteria bacterium]